MPSRHYSAFIIGLFPSVYDWVTNISNRSPLSDPLLSYDTNSPGASGWVGVLAWKRGALLVSMLWVAILVNVLDRQWKLASIWAIVAAVFAVFGIIHVPQAGFSSMTQAPWEHCLGEDACWEFAYQWMFVVAYCMMAATCAIIFFASGYDSQLEDPIDDESRHAFDDWFKDAYKGSASDPGDESKSTNKLEPETKEDLMETESPAESEEVAP